jgi:hypothetical protein
MQCEASVVRSTEIAWPERDRKTEKRNDCIKGFVVLRRRPTSGNDKKAPMVWYSPCR